MPELQPIADNIKNVEVIRGINASEAGKLDLPTPVLASAASCEFAERIIDELPFLRRIVRRWYGAGADAEDLVQNTVLRALANSQQWEPGTNLRAWLFTIMRNCFLGEKASSVRADLAMQCYPNSLPKPGGLERQDARLMLRDAQRVIGRLPQMQRTALLLIGAEGCSHDTVAKTLGISVGALRCHLTRARARLRKAILDVELTSPLASRHAAQSANRQIQLVEQHVNN